jgi:DNA-binding NtrC family response regulator
MALLTAFHWPGNVRQLENAIFRAVVLAEGEEIGVNEIPQIAAQAAIHAGHDGTGAPMLVEPSPATAAAWPDQGDRLDSGHDHALPTGPSMAMVDDQNHVRPLDDIEREAIRFAIAHYHGQMSEVARRLKIGRSTLYRKLEGLGLDESGLDGNVNGAAENEPAEAS